MYKNNKKALYEAVWFKVVFVLVLCAILSFVPYAILNWDWGYHLNETEPHKVADTIGGILSPAVAFISAILVYLAFEEQVKANKKIQSQIDGEKKAKFEELIFNETKKDLKQLYSDINDFKERIVNPKLSALMDDYVFADVNSLDSETMGFLDEVDYYLGKFVEIVNSFLSNVKEQKAYKILIKKQSQSFLIIFRSPRLEEILSAYLVSRKMRLPDGFLQIGGGHVERLKQMQSFKKLREVLSHEQDSGESEEDIALTAFNQVVEDYTKYWEFDYLQRMRQQNILKSGTDGGYINLDEDYRSFIKELRERDWYGISEEGEGGSTLIIIK